MQIILVRLTVSYARFHQAERERHRLRAHPRCAECGRPATNALKLVICCIQPMQLVMIAA
jgi:hypothetical protein